MVVTPRSFDVGLRRKLEQEVREVRYVAGPLTPRELVAALHDADGLIAGLDDLNAEVFERASRLRVVARYGSGLDSVDLRAAEQYGVTVTFTPGCNANAVAELTMAFMLLLARRLVPFLSVPRRGASLPLAVELRGRTLGVLGIGRIGSLVAAKAHALGMHVAGYDPNPIQSPAVIVGLSDLLPVCDIISLHLPLTTSTYGLVDSKFLGKLKPGALLINTARGELIDEPAVVSALDHGLLGGAAFDVATGESWRAAHPLLARPDVLVTPHIAAHTLEATEAMGEAAIHDVIAVLNDRPPRFPAAIGLG